MAHRIGRKHAAETYPESKGDTTLVFARNFAQGPGTSQTLSTSPQEISWGAIESGAPAGVNVPVTPKVTGLLLVQAVVEIDNPSEASAAIVTVQVGVGGVALATPATQVTIPEGELATVPIQALVAEAVGTTSEINVFVSTNLLGVVLQANDSTLSVQEVPAATG
jgi:hypothetical protein